MKNNRIWYFLTTYTVTSYHRNAKGNRKYLFWVILKMFWWRHECNVFSIHWHRSQKSDEFPSSRVDWNVHWIYQSALAKNFCEVVLQGHELRRQRCFRRNFCRLIRKTGKITNSGSIRKWQTIIKQFR